MANNPLTDDKIRSLCGTDAFDRGRMYFRLRKVVRLSYDPDLNRYDAVVAGSRRYNVRIELGEADGVDAACSCPAFESYDTYCKHIAATLMQIREAHAEPTPKVLVKPSGARPAQAAPSSQLAREVLALFDAPAAPALRRSGDALPDRGKALLEAEFTCHVVDYAFQKSLLALEMKVGRQRLYVVQKIKDFLAKIEQQAPYSFARNFVYDPAAHRFKDADWLIVQALIDIRGSEALYGEALSGYSSYAYTLRNDRLLIVPPLAWERLLPLLGQAKVRFQHMGKTYDRLVVTDGKPPVRFVLNEAEDGAGCELDAQGLERLTVLESYGAAAADGVLHRLPPGTAPRLAGLKNKLQLASRRTVPLAPEHLGAFLDRAVPELKRMAELEVAPAVAGRIVNRPLRARLRLRREGERLTARLLYAYGDIAFDPLAAGAASPDRLGRIVLRDAEKESRIMDVLEQSSFKYNGSELYMEDEEEIYRFLYHLLPQLRPLADIETDGGLGMPRDYPFMRASAELNPKTQWLEIGFEMDGFDEAEIRDILRALVEKRKYYRLADGAYLSLETDAFREIGDLLEGMGVRKADVRGARLELPAMRGFYLADAADGAPGAEGGGAGEGSPAGAWPRVRIGAAFRRLLDDLKHPDRLAFPVPEGLAPILRDYQKYGFQWLKTLARYGFGGILADDMGLGKTLQSIAFIVSELPQRRRSGMPSLIVCPASLMYNWQQELRRFAPEVNAAVAAGDPQERGELLDGLAEVDVLITSYPLLRRDLAFYAERRFHALFLDEAQMIKNHATQTAQAVKAVRATHRFALTGTPIENKLEELWSIMDAVFPELFPSRQAFVELAPDQVARKVRPFVLRRLKSDVLKELPDKIETTRSSELTDEQKKLYVAYLARLREETARRLAEDGFRKSRMRILAGLTRLRQLCCHPALFVESYEGGSGKLEQLLDLVDECLDGGKRMLIFSQFTEMLGIIRRELDLRGLPSFYLDGKTPPGERVELCRRFNEGERDLFLISLKAGGTGLNLTGADTVVLYDLWWNPAVEQQAADRAHRIGQKNVVQVIRLVTQGTIEEKMHELQQRKKDLIDQVVGAGDQALTSLSESDVRELLTI